jgi:hypothetical protein
MYRYRYIVAKCMIVQDIYCEEEGDVYKPALDRDAVRFEEKGRAFNIELRGVADRRDEDKLDKGE